MIPNDPAAIVPAETTVKAAEDEAKKGSTDWGGIGDGVDGVTDVVFGEIGHAVGGAVMSAVEVTGTVVSGVFEITGAILGGLSDL